MIVNVNDINLYYEKRGVGKPLILLHGNGEDHHIFDRLAVRLEKDYTVYAIDSRNHGQSEKTEIYTYETMAEDIYRFILDLGLEGAYFVGFSDGAIISLLMAMKHGDVMGKMALLGINLKPEDFTEESYQYVKQTYEETKDPLFKLMLEQPSIELDEVKEVRVPVLLVAAGDDIFKPESFTALLETLPQAKLKVMEGHDHASYIIGQDILYPDLAAFFQ